MIQEVGVWNVCAMMIVQQIWVQTASCVLRISDEVEESFAQRREPLLLLISHARRPCEDSTIATPSMFGRRKQGVAATATHLNNCSCNPHLRRNRKRPHSTHRILNSPFALEQPPPLRGRWWGLARRSEQVGSKQRRPCHYRKQRQRMSGVF